MQTYIAFLRGINVGGHKKILMADLKAMCQKIGFKNVVTYIQSGNLIIKSTITKNSILQVQLAKGILDTFGFEVPVLVKTKMELQQIFDGNTFASERNEDITRLYFTMLGKTPNTDLITELLQNDYGTEEFYINHDTVYFYCPKNGYGRTKLDNNFFEKKLKVPATTRNFKTLQKLLELIH